MRSKRVAMDVTLKMGKPAGLCRAGLYNIVEEIKREQRSAEVECKRIQQGEQAALRKKRYRSSSGRMAHKNDYGS
ncbi:hypothetical protein M514_02843 [Trichuris suis]|uniref:Uncharacterized protein n=1 Tax=Trichuris suis TaxID=68888 RepID=A0A085NEQ7_9BILA|nr:hypothetical protein M513_02843 [Trichuris suis]KFD67953.1 hypothetical protein M514_02843 [Trichuris suis]